MADLQGVVIRLQGQVTELAAQLAPVLKNPERLRAITWIRDNREHVSEVRKRLRILATCWGIPRQKVNGLLVKRFHGQNGSWFQISGDNYQAMLTWLTDSADADCPDELRAKYATSKGQLRLLDAGRRA